MTIRNALGIDLSGIRRSSIRLRYRIPLYALAYTALYGIAFPSLAYVWFAVLTVILAFLYSDRRADELMLISMAVVTAVRVTAYYNNDLSRDIAKILPYGLLGIFLVNLGGFDYQASIALLDSMAAEEDQAFYYWIYISVQELVLRITQPTISYLYGLIKEKVSSQVRKLSDDSQQAD